MAEETFFEGTVDPLAILSYGDSRSDRPVITANGSLIITTRLSSSPYGLSSYGYNYYPINVEYVLSSGASVSGSVLDDFQSKFTSRAGVVRYDMILHAGFYPNIREWQYGDPTAPISWEIYTSLGRFRNSGPYYNIYPPNLSTLHFEISFCNIRTDFYAASSFLHPAHLGTACYYPETGRVTLQTYPNNEPVSPTQYEHLALYRWRSGAGNYVYTESIDLSSGTSIFSQPFQHAAWNQQDGDPIPDFAIGHVVSATNETSSSGHTIGHHFTSSEGVTYYRDLFQPSLKAGAPPVYPSS